MNSVDQQVPNPLAYNALSQIGQQKENIKAKEGFWKAYLWSVMLPPIGIYYFVKYYFFGEGNEGMRKAAIISLILTVASLFLNIWLIQLFFSQAASVNDPNLNSLKELITPENQKSLQNLLQ